ncbi:3-methyl-2-oxobutanoate hydroxymethyltransferase, partial [Leptospira borgpetersenii serovar Hardjo-bovis]|uniref:3-methyl-2-oxobutanoate hydroxymethyltransferase n=1 Tax=Leptospira borgpetersenii TaxID=174 RepID=UPI00188160E1|nr:3-methyl-2-oxobutanoate hydroxymethyltransferase [Leptospira borgpetersenii serovar Hardjo-bovis]
IGISVMGQFGVTPPSGHVFGGHRGQGEGGESSAKLLREGVGLFESGAFPLVLEIVLAQLGKKDSEESGGPATGIGGGLSKTEKPKTFFGSHSREKEYKKF